MSEHVVHFTKEITKALADIGKDFTAHSIFSPSGSAMWAYCSGSLVPNLFAKDKSGAEAAEGTVGHGVGELWLKTGEKPIHLLGTVETVVNGDETYEIEIDETMFDYVQQYVDWCATLPGNHFVETRVDFSDLTPLKKQTGTADHAACQPGVLTITDLKYGKGVQVFAENNTQAILYAYGFFRKYDELFDFQRIIIRICQPRLHHFDVWEISREELLRWAAWLKERAYAAWCKDAVRTPGEKQCRWCKIKADCAAHAVLVARLTDGVFENLDDPITAPEMQEFVEMVDGGLFSFQPISLHALTVDQKAKLLPYRKMVESWFNDLAEDLEARAMKGEVVPGFKLVEARTNRAFKNQQKAIEELEFLGLDYDVIRPRGMITPAQAEDALVKIGYRRKQMEDLLGKVVTKPPGKPTMVPESDKRDTIQSKSDGVFDNLDEL